MIYLLHGDDIARSRNELFTLKASFPGREVREISGKSLEESDLIQSLSSQSLFGDELVVIIENICSANAKKPKKLEELLTSILNESQKNTIILWEEKEASKTALSILTGKAKITLFKLPTQLFQFLDGIRPQNLHESIRIFTTLIQSEPPELIHAMLVKRVRQLLLLVSGETLESSQAWQVSRLTNQSKFFTLKGLTKLYHDVILADYQMKSGLSSMSLDEQIQHYLLLNL